jgi:cohesin loading factor subunit SCC2
LGVRRRIVKLLKVLYHVVPDEANRIDICKRLVFRVADEDDGIKVCCLFRTVKRRLTFLSPSCRISLLIRLRNSGLAQLTRRAPERTSDSWRRSSSRQPGSTATVPLPLTRYFETSVRVFSPFARFSHALSLQIMAKHVEKGTPAPLNRVKEVMEALIDGLVEDDQEMVRSFFTLYQLGIV